MEDIGLKACPFCGGLAESRRYYNSYVGRRYFIVGNWNGRTEVEESK